MKSIDHPRHDGAGPEPAPPSSTMVPVTVLLPDGLYTALRAEGLLAADVLRELLSAELERRTADRRAAPRRPIAERSTNPGLELVTPAEWRVLDLLATHLTLAEIAARLFVTRATVKSHVASLYQKLDVSRRADAVAALLAATERPAPQRLAG